MDWFWRVPLTDFANLSRMMAVPQNKNGNQVYMSTHIHWAFQPFPLLYHYHNNPMIPYIHSISSSPYTNSFFHFNKTYPCSLSFLWNECWPVLLSMSSYWLLGNNLLLHISFWQIISFILGKESGVAESKLSSG